MLTPLRTSAIGLIATLTVVATLGGASTMPAAVAPAVSVPTLAATMPGNGAPSHLSPSRDLSPIQPYLSMLPSIAKGAPHRLIQPVHGVRIATATHSSILPPLAWSDGISPGAQIYISFDGSDFPQYLCSSNFVWKDHSSVLYLGAAGHCFLPEGTTATTNAGSDGDVNPATSGYKFWACWEDCLFGGQTGGVMENFIVQNAVALGQVAYARQTQSGQDIGRDFGIITIPSSLYGDVRPEVPVWGGPVGINPSSLGLETVLIHGNAAYDGETFLTKSRAGISLGDAGDGSFAAVLKSSGGDSGSAIQSVDPLSGDVPGVSVPKAMGILTHGLGDPVTGFGLGLMYGTNVPEAQALANQAGLCIVPVEAGESVSPSVTAAPAC